MPTGNLVSDKLESWLLEALVVNWPKFQYHVPTDTDARKFLKVVNRRHCILSCRSAPGRVVPSFHLTTLKYDWFPLMR